MLASFALVIASLVWPRTYPAKRDAPATMKQVIDTFNGDEYEPWTVVPYDPRWLVELPPAEPFTIIEAIGPSKSGTVTIKIH